MGAVYVAEHKLMSSEAAVKVLLPEYSNNKEVVDRFFNEAKAATMVQHPGIIKIFDFGYADDGSAFIVMELLKGDALSERLTDGAMRESDVIRVTRQAARALSAAHAAGIVHRDLKPDNFIIVRDAEVSGGERVKLLDFGIAKLMGAQSAVKTRAGAAMGTPVYMAPEQCRGVPDIDHRADIYALGCVVFHMACGRPPFGDVEDVDILAILGQHLYEPVPLPHSINPDISTTLEQTILKMLAKEPGERFQTMDEVVDALDGLSGGRFQTSPGERVPPELAAAIMGEAPPPKAASQTSPGAATRVLGTSEDNVAAAQKSTTPTTLGTSVSIITNVGVDPEPSKTKRWIGIGVAVAAAAAVAFALVGTDGDAASAAKQPAEPPAVAPAPEPEPAPEPAPPPALPVEMVAVSIESEPAGADVYRAVDGVKVGITPYNDAYERGEGELVLILKQEGYEPARVNVSLAVDTTETIALTAVPEKKTTPRKKRQRKDRGNREWGDLMD